MEPFSIHCSTCSARIKVRLEEAIGQILACPKCGSMVLIERPSAEQAMRAEAVALMAREAVGKRVTSSGASSSGMLAESFDEVDLILTPGQRRGAKTRATQQASASPPESDTALPGETTRGDHRWVGSPAPDMNVSSPSGRSSATSWPLLVAAAILGAILAFGLFQL